MLILSIFEKKNVFEIFDPQFKIFKNTLRAVEISDDPKIFGIVDLDPKVSPDMCVRIF